MGWLEEWRRPDRMELVRLLRKEEPGVGWLAVLAVFTGVVNAALLVILHQAAQYYGRGGVSLQFFVLFALAVAIYLHSRRHLFLRSSEIVDRVVEEMRGRISRKVRHAGLLPVHGITQARIHQVLAEGGELIGNGTSHLARAMTSAIMLASSFAYVALFSGTAFVISAVFLVGMFLVGGYLTRESRADFARARETEGKFLTAFQHLLDGLQEVKLHQPRGDDLVDGRLKSIAGDVRTQSQVSHPKAARTELAMAVFFWGLFAANVFVLPQFAPIPPDILMTITMVLLFIFGNLENFVTSAPIVTKANVAIRTLEELEAQLAAADDESATTEASELAGKKTFREIVLAGVRFRYPDSERERGFVLGPIDLVLAAGETVFLCGGNGSGKSTLMRVVSGLYLPDDGSLSIDGATIGASNRVHYRNLFSGVLSEFHLFDRLYGLFAVAPERVESTLRRVELADHVRYLSGGFSTLDLSSGQKKRLALAVSLLEDRPICVFDEVAADLDPAFRKRYYEEFLPELRREGKTLIVGTHDERYFDRCDRLLTMSDGRIRYTPGLVARQGQSRQ